MKRPKPERTQPKNPNQLTVKQHVFPARSIDRFVNQDGRVSVYDMVRRKQRLARPDDVLFCARRAWDHRAEAGYMKHIEDEFQAVVRPIIDGQAASVAPEQKPTIDRMFALWYMRARYRELDSQEIQLKGITGSELSKAQEENLEKNGYLFTRKGGKMPTRQLNGLQLQRRIDGYTDDLATVTRWAVIRPQEGEFIVPDVPMHTILPLTPTLALAASVPDGVITERNLAEINRSFRAASQAYFFARDLSQCRF